MNSQPSAPQITETVTTTSTVDLAQTPTSSPAAPATWIALSSTVPVLTVIALQFAAGDFNPLEFIIDSYGYGGHTK